VVFGRILKHPASGRIVFNAYNVYAPDIQRKQPPRKIFSCGQKWYFASAKIKKCDLKTQTHLLKILITFKLNSKNEAHT
jgi:hypothetical protein